MRVPNGAKMDPKSALFLRVTIMRIHCKKQGLGGGDFILKLDKNQVFICFCKKTAFSQPSISPRREAYFSGLRTIFSLFCACFSIVFFGANFGVMHSKHRVWSAKYSTFGASGMLAHLETSGFWVKNRRRKGLLKNWLFNDLFLKSSPLPHRSSMLGGFMSEKSEKNMSFLCFFKLMFFVILRSRF